MADIIQNKLSILSATQNEQTHIAINKRTINANTNTEIQAFQIHN